MSSDLEDYRWLVGEEAGALLQASADAIDTLQLVTRLRKTLSSARAALVAEQVGLRRRAVKKFPAASRLYFTKTGLEQATDAVTSRYKAARFPGHAPTADLCCGIGGDLLALGLRGPTIGYDLDAPTSIFAAANVRMLHVASGGALQAGVVCAKAEAAHLADVAAWHIDPDRRPGGKRTTHIELHEPSVETLETFLAVNAAAAIKLAPAAEPWPAWTDRAEWEWLSLDGECRQLVAWFGALTERHGSRRATILSGDRAPRSIVGEPDDALSYEARLAVVELGRYLHEPDAAILAAKLTTAAGAEHGLSSIFSGSAYLTSDHPIVDDEAWTSFEIVEALPFDLRKLRTWLAERRIGRLEMKKRGVDFDLERLRSELKLRGEESACLILIRRGDRVTAVVTRRVENGGRTTDS
ncbi:MAG: hypothetical protein K8U03_08205 [Planctomycetia bacterium]|nr:hypothetical protein [Planctomycetia bacterium]